MAAGGGGMMKYLVPVYYIDKRRISTCASNEYIIIRRWALCGFCRQLRAFRRILGDSLGDKYRVENQTGIESRRAEAEKKIFVVS